MTRLEFNDGTSHKFWEIAVEGTSHTVRYGKVGSNGQSKTKSFDSEEQAQAAADKLIAQKRKKGYEDTGASDESSSAPEASAAGATASATTAATATPATGPGTHATNAGIEYVISEEELCSDDIRAARADAEAGNVSGLTTWLAKGATLEQWSNLTAYAAKAGQPETCALLLSIGATESLELSARLAAQEGHQELVELFVAHGFDLDHCDAKDKSVLTAAASNGRLELTKWIVGQKKIRKKSTQKALRLACQQNHMDIVRFLVEEAKVDINAKEGRDKSTVVSAARRGHLDVLAYLRKNGATLDGSLGSAALEKALGSGKEDAFLWLLDNGANLAKGAIKDSIRTCAEGGLVSVLAKLNELGIVYREAAASDFTETFAFLCSSDDDTRLLNAMATAVQKVVGKKSKVFHFANEVEFDWEPPTTETIPDGIPASFGDIARHLGSVTWDAGGPEMGYGGIHEDGYIIGSDGGLDAVSEADEELAERLTEAGACDSFCCGQNFLLFDPTRKNAAGEDALSFVSHGDCEWTEVKSADSLDYKGVLLRLMAQASIEANELPEIYA